MRNRLARLFLVAAVTAIPWLGPTAPATAQQLPASTADQAKPTAAKAIPRAPDGHPDLSGIWQAGGVSLYGETGEVVPGSSGVSGPGGPRREPAPYQPWALEKVKELAADNRNDPAAHCFLPGLPRITTYPMPFEIVQTAKKTVFLYEAMHGFRIIPSDGRGHPPDLDPSFMGDSVAHWEGDTFVVDVTGFNEKTWLGPPGSFHSQELHLTERYTRMADDTLRYEAIAEDPKVFTKPWKTVSVTLRHPPRDERIMEYECIEGNIDLPHIQSGSRTP